MKEPNPSKEAVLKPTNQQVTRRMGIVPILKGGPAGISWGHALF